MSGGGGGSRSTTQTTKMEPPREVAPYLAPFMQRASDLSVKPWEAYGGQRMADFTPDHQAGFDMARHAANQSNDQLQGVLGQVGAVAGGADQGYSPQQVQPGSNVLLGQSNPYLQQQIDAAQGDVVRQFNNTRANGTDAAFARAGAFGGSAWQQAQAENQRQLAGELGNVSNSMRMQDYQLQAQLGEQDLNRQMQAGQFNAALGDRAYQSGRQRMLQAAGILPGLSNAGYQNARVLLGIGDAQQAQTQGGLDSAYQDWLAEKNHPNQQLDVMGNAIRTVMGSGGTTSQTGPNPNQRSPAASLLGGAFGGAGLGAGLFPAVAGATPWGAIGGAGLGILGGLL